MVKYMICVHAADFVSRGKVSKATLRDKVLDKTYRGEYIRGGGKDMPRKSNAVDKEVKNEK